MKLTGSQIGKQAAAKSKGLFSAEDWMCSKCVHRVLCFELKGYMKKDPK